MAKHTPGPWTIVLNDYDSTLEVISRKGKPIANVCTESLLCEWDFIMSKEEAMANAAIIAAAPEMCEALKELLPPDDMASNYWWCPTCKRAVPGTEVTYEECHEICGTYIGAVNDSQWLRKAKDAIAKTEGDKSDENISDS